eukprot:scaffold3780_cov66-Cyclotella_meneghiniana.AAC.9
MSRCITKDNSWTFWQRLLQSSSCIIDLSARLPQFTDKLYKHPLNWKSMSHHRNTPKQQKDEGAAGTVETKPRSSGKKQCQHNVHQRSPSLSTSSSITSPVSLTSFAQSTPSRSPLSPPCINRFTNSPIDALKIFRDRNGALPVPPLFGKPVSHTFPIMGHASVRNDEPNDNDQRERSIQLIKQWYQCQKKIDATKSKHKPKTDSIHVVEKKPDLDSKQSVIETDMSIHSASLRGTIEAAAWHLHGQSGGRVTPLPSDKSRFGENVCVMNSNAMSRMRKNDRLARSKEDCAAEEDIESGQCGDATNVVVDSNNRGDTLITSKVKEKNDENIGDMWSTGVASAIVMGVAARYNKTLFMFPHGRRVLLPSIMAIMALALSIYVSASCRFMNVLPSTNLNQVFQIGPWFYLSTDSQSYEKCVPYTSDIELDLWFTVARAMSALSVCLGLGLLLWTCTLTCIPYSLSSLNSLGICYFIAATLQISTSFFFLSNNCIGSVDESGNIFGGGYFGGVECTANQDLVFCIAASALYFATGWLLFVAQGVIALDPGKFSSEVYTWSAALKSDDTTGKRMRTIEKSWIRIPDGSTVMATVVVERRRGEKGCIKTTHKVKTEIMPAC